MSARVDELERMVTRMYAEERARMDRQLIWLGLAGFILGFGSIAMSLYTIVSVYLYGSLE